MIFSAKGCTLMAILSGHPTRDHILLEQCCYSGKSELAKMYGVERLEGHAYGKKATIISGKQKLNDVA